MVTVVISTVVVIAKEISGLNSLSREDEPWNGL
jgi:hypothetical protein